jgi:preprotein translocase subunit SecG
MSRTLTRVARSGQIRSKHYAKKTAGPKKGGPKKSAKKPAGKSPKKPVTGHSKVMKYANYIKTDSKGGLVIDINAVKAAQANASKAKPKLKSAPAQHNHAPSSVSHGNHQFEDPAVVEERNRLANMPPPPPPPQVQMPQGMYGQYQQMFGLQQPQVSNQRPQQSQQMPQQGMDYPMYGTGGVQPIYGGYDYNSNVMVQPVQPDPNARRPQVLGGVLMPNELPGAGLGSGSGAGANAGSSNGDFMSIIGALKTEEMIALACGGAGFLLFIVVIIVIIIRFKKKQQKKKKKSQDEAREDWKASQDTLSPPPGYQHSYSSKDPAHIARIQGRQLPPPPPLSFTQSAGVTGMTTASGTYMSDERPSMRHKD